MASRPGFLAHLRLTRSGSTLEGYLTQVYTDKSSDTGYSTSRDDLTGTSIDGAVTLIQGEGTREWDGDYQDGVLFLSHRRADGTVARLTFRRVTAEQWETAFSDFQQQIPSGRVGLHRSTQNYSEQERVARHREQLARDLAEAERAVSEETPTCLKWEKKLADARVATQKAQAASDTAKQRLEDAQDAFDDRQDEVKQTARRRSRGENLAELDALQNQDDELRALIATARKRFRALSAAKRAEESVRYEYERHASTLTRSLTTVMSIRSEMKRLSLALQHFGERNRTQARQKTQRLSANRHTEQNTSSDSHDTPYNYDHTGGHDAEANFL